MSQVLLQDDFYDHIKPQLHRRIGKELRLAKRVLDIGCGSCELVKYLAETYCQEVAGVDISSGSFPARRHTHNGVRFRCLKRNAVRLSFVDDGSVDAIVATWALHEMADPKAVLAETRRVLRPGGKLLIVDFPKDSLAQQLWDENYYRPEAVKTLLKEAGFEGVRVRLIEQEQIIWAHGFQPPTQGDTQCRG